MRLPGEKQKETVKLVIMGVLLFLACFLIYYYHVVLKTGTVFTHFFYIPIILASLWWQRKGVVVALFLAAVLTGSHLFLRLEMEMSNDFLRAPIFLIISVVVAS